MKINELIKSISNLVETRKIINHGSIRCLPTADAAVRSDDCDEVGTETIGDDDLAAGLAELAVDGDRIADLHLGDLVKMEDAYRGDDISDYVDDDREDELSRLDLLIDRARELF